MMWGKKYMCEMSLKRILKTIGMMTKKQEMDGKILKKKQQGRHINTHIFSQKQLWVVSKKENNNCLGT